MANVVAQGISRKQIRAFTKYVRELCGMTDQLYFPVVEFLEIKTGKLVGGKSHVQKGTERLRNLERISKRETLTKQERKIVEDLIKDLKRALGGK